MFDAEIEAMLRRPGRTIAMMVAAGAVGLAIAYAMQTYGFPWMGGFEW